MNTLDRINRLRGHFNLPAVTAPVGGHGECDDLDARFGVETHGAATYNAAYSLRRGHMRPPNLVGTRLALLEAAQAAAGRYRPWQPSNTFWLGMEGLTVLD